MGKKMQRLMFIIILGIVLIFLHAYFVDKSFSHEQKGYRRSQDYSFVGETVIRNMYITYSSADDIDNSTLKQFQKTVPQKQPFSLMPNLHRLQDFVEKEGQFFIPTSVSESFSQNVIPESMTRYVSLTNKTYNPYIAKEKSRTCLQLVSAKDKVHLNTVRKIRKYMRVTRSKLKSDMAVFRMFSNCTKIREFLYSFTSSSTTSNIYPIAYSILLDKPVEQTMRLLRAVYSPFNIYCLHVNENASPIFKKLIKKLQSCMNNILVPTRTYSVIPQTIHRLYAEISCFKTLLNNIVPWKYIINIPGSVFPLKNNSMLVEYLKAKSYNNEMSAKIPESQRFFKRARYVHKLKKHGRSFVYLRTKTLKSLPPRNLTLFRGDSIFISTREFANFAITSQLGKALLAWAVDTKNPEEFFWATLNRYPGSPGGLPYRVDDFTEEEAFEQTNKGIIGQENIADLPESDLIATLWYSDKSHKCRGKYRGYQCTFASGDLRWLLQQDKLFAAPFDLKLDSIVLDCLYQHLRDPLVRDVVFRTINDVTDFL